MGPQNPQPPAPPATDYRAGAPASSSDATLSEALLVLRKRRWVLLVAIIFGFAYGIYRSASQPRLYVATGRIEVRSGSSNEYRLTTAAAAGLDSSNHLTTESSILTSETLLLTVARELNLNNEPAFLGVRPPIPTTSLDTPKIRQATLARLKSGLSVAPVQRTDLITITYRSLDANLSANIVNTLIKDYIQRSYQTRFNSAQHASQWLTGQLDDLKQQVETSQEQLLELQRRLGSVGLSLDPTHGSQSEITSLIDTLTKAAGDARITRIISESRYRALASTDPAGMEGLIDATPGVQPGPLNNLRSELATARAHYAELNTQLGPSHPQVKALKAQMDELTSEINVEQGRLLNQAKQTYLAAKAAEEQTQAALDSQKADAYKLRDELVEYTLRQREFESGRQLYDSLLQRLRAAGIQAGLESLEIDVVDQALIPAAPSLQSQTSIIIVTLIFSLFGGIIVAFLLESLDTGLRSIAEVEALTELPALAIIPRSRRTVSELPSGMSVTQVNMGVLTMPKSQFAEAFRSLRTSILLATSPHPPRTILFTSATPSEGKTTCATNLSCILAQRETKVLLIDADLRRPSVHHRFGLNGKVGLSTVLTGATTLEEAVQQVSDVPNLDILPSGPVPPFPTEMLSSDGMQSLLQEAKEKYTHVVIDSPPILSVTDGVILGRQTDAAVLVIRHGKSSKQVVRRARDLLIRSGIHVTGFILNAVDINSPEYYGYYGYSGYSYANLDSETWETATLPKKRKDGDA
ncbi:GumC family protein [Terriglobus tenax]|uniref:GumC family protein n=1 Tax=Terriglobus tenax TaxID=1111115 RepID=UPI0021DFA2E5|nr:polysaccharide biosynthesis tyrosine autokinase [Terriglobus tenax]